MNGTLLVVAGVHVRNARLLLARRPAGGAHPGLWEFPGGKVEEGETPEQALVREWREELGATPAGLKPFDFATTRTSDGRHATLLFFTVRGILGEPRAIAVDAIRTSNADEARLLAVVPADVATLQRLLREGRGHFVDTEDAEGRNLAARAAEEEPYIAGSETLSPLAPVSFVKRLSPGPPIEGFLVRTDGGVRAFENRCPHVPIPLDRDTESFVSEDGETLVCRTHGALFAPGNGLCVAGPCKGKSLRALSVRSEGAGWVLETD